MGRANHLAQTLPRIVAEFGGAVLVDWSCPSNSGDWAEKELGAAVRVVRVKGERFFHKTRALNLGIARAREEGAEWILILDADTIVRPGLRAACEALARAGNFAIGDRLWPGPRWRHHLGGILLVSCAALVSVGGYDEAFRDYGPEDVELRCRLRLLGGLNCVDLPPELVDSLPHSDALRTKHAAEPDLARSAWKNGTLLASRVRAWTGRDLRLVPEIRDLLIGRGCRMIMPVVTAVGAGAEKGEALERLLATVGEEFGQAVVVDPGKTPDRDVACAAASDSASIVTVPGAELGFASARNAGARKAAELGADWLLFLDVGTNVPDGARLVLEGNARAGSFYYTDDARGPAWGTLFVAWNDFLRAGEYDEVASGNDVNRTEAALRRRLVARAGLTPAPLATAPHARDRALPGEDWLEDSDPRANPPDPVVGGNGEVREARSERKSPQQMTRRRAVERQVARYLALRQKA